MFWSVFSELCDSVCKSPYVVATELGIRSSATITYWRQGAVPRRSMLEKISKYFGVSVEYLLGESTGSSHSSHGRLPAYFDDELVSNFMDLTYAERELVLTYMSGIKAARKLNKQFQADFNRELL